MRNSICLSSIVHADEAERLKAFLALETSNTFSGSNLVRGRVMITVHDATDNSIMAQQRFKPGDVAEKYFAQHGITMTKEEAVVVDMRVLSS